MSRREHFDTGHGMPDHTIVHHGRWYSNTLDPHDTHDFGFHAGTWQSVVDRLSGNWHEEASWADPGDIMPAEVHSYAVPNDLIDTNMWADPMTHDKSQEDRSVEKAPEEVKKSKVLPYKNEFEDPGSTSYLIHPEFVYSGRVKHLGSQIIGDLYIPDEENEGDEPELIWEPTAKNFDPKNLRGGND